MADSPINGFTLTKTDTPAGSYFGFDWWDGTEWKTARILAEDLASALGAPNFANSNLQLTGDRIHDANGNDLTIGKLTRLNFESIYAPPTSQPSIRIRGYGALSSDLVFTLDCDSGTIMKMFGDLSTQILGNVGIGGAPLASRRLTVTTTDPVGTTSTGDAIGVQGYGTSGMGGYFEGNSGIKCYANAGEAVYGESFSGLGGSFKGSVLIQPYGGAASMDASAVLQASSTTKGALLPKMTTTERDAISSPATGLEIYNTTNNRKEVYNGSYWGAIVPTSINITSGSVNMTSGSNFFFGNTTIFPTTTAANRQFISPVSGTIRKAFIRSFAGTVAGDRSINVYIRINSTDYLVATVASSSANREFINTSLNIPVVANTDTVVCYAVASGGTTDSTGVYFGGQIIVE